MTQKSNKSAIMWNVQEPDDPYDIKKSMIAKLPDHPSKPMGQYLEVVCLLQSAQIERLSDFLTQLRAKYRQIQRRQLDRHSYQVQIKELAEKTYAYNTVKSENDRLKDFIRRQTLQLQELQKSKMNTMSLQVLQAKYDSVLNELKISRQQKQRLQISISKLNYEVTEWRGKWERSELEKSSQKSQLQVEFRQRLNFELKITNQKANQRNQKLQIEIRQLKEYIENKNQEIASLMSQREQFARQIRLLQDKNKSRGNVEESLNQKNREIQRLNQQLSQKNMKLEQVMSSMQKLGGQNRILQERYFLLQKENETLVIKIRQRQNDQSLRSREEFDRYEDKIAMMSMEIERLNGLNIGKGRQLSELNMEIQRLRLELIKTNSLRQQLERERDRLRHLQGQSQIKVAQQSRIALLTQQLQRVNMQLRLRNQEFITLNQRYKNAQMNSNQLLVINAENNRLKQQLQASRTELWNYKNITENQLKSLRTEYSKVIKDMENMQARHSESQKYRLQCDRLRVELDRIRNQSIMIKRGVEQQRASNSRYITQRNRLADTNTRLTQDNIRLTQENKRLSQELRLVSIQIIQVNKQKDEMVTILRSHEEREDTIRALHQQLESRRDRIEQLQGTVQKIYGEIDRLHALLSAKTNQHLRLSKEYAQFEDKYKFLQAKLNNALGQKDYYEKQFSKFKTQMQNMSRFTGDAQRQIQSKTRQFAIEKERYERVIVQNQKLIAEYVREKQELEKRLIDMQRELAMRVPQQEQIKEQLRREQMQIREELRYKQTLILQLQNTIKEKEIYYKEGEDRSKQFQSRVIEWQSRLKEAERGIYMRDQQKQQLVQENKRIGQDRQRLNQDLHRIGQDLKRANQQIMRLNMQLGRLNQQNSSFKLQITRINQQYSSYKIQLSKITEQFNRQTEVISRTRKDEQSKFRQKWDSLNQQNLRLRMKIDELSSQQKSRANEEQMRISIMRAEQALKNEKIQSQNARMQVRRLQELINRQKIEIQALRESAKEYQLKIVHIETANSKHFQERLKQEESRLQDQLKLTQSNLHEKQNLIVNMQRQINQLQKELRACMQKYRSAQANLDQYQDKIGLVSVENQRLNSLVRQKMTVQRERNILIERLEQQIRDLSQSRHVDSSQKYLIEITNLKTTIQELENINMHTIAQRDQLFKICHQIKAQQELEKAKLTQEQRRIKTELQFRGEESRRFGQQVGILRKKEQTYLNKIRQLEDLLSRPQEDPNLRRRLNQLQNIVSVQTRQIQELRVENTNLHTTVRQMEIIIHEERERRVTTSRDELNVLNSKINQYIILINGKQEEVAMWQNKYTSLYTAYEQLYVNYNFTKSQYEVTLNNIKDYEQKIFRLQQNFNAITQALRTSRNDFDNLVIQNRELKLKLQGDGQLYEKNLLLSKEIDRLTQINKSMKLQIQEIRLRLTDNVSLSKRIEEHLALFVVLFAEIQSLRSRLANSEHECQEVRRSSLAPLRVDRSARRS